MYLDLRQSFSCGTWTTLVSVSRLDRVIRLGDKSKTFGLVCVPTYDKVGIGTARKVQAVVDVVFNQGQPAISEIRR